MYIIIIQFGSLGVAKMTHILIGHAVNFKSKASRLIIIKNLPLYHNSLISLNYTYLLFLYHSFTQTTYSLIPLICSPIRADKEFNLLKMLLTCKIQLSPRRPCLLSCVLLSSVLNSPSVSQGFVSPPFLTSCLLN